MTLQEKERKIKLIMLILLVQSELYRKTIFKDCWEAIALSMETVYWFKELHKVNRQRTSDSVPNYEKGCIVGNNNQPEIILRK